MKRLPLGIQTFKEIISGNYIYVDKTQYVYNLIGGAKYHFLSRPRRFGKSLLLDTVGEAFGGDKELFKGLWIYDSDYDFVKHPVIRLDMSRISNISPDVLEQSILSYLGIYYTEEGFERKDSIAADAFAKLIILLKQKYNQRVVVLIDEYDKPILDHITNIEIAEANRQVIKGFYGILKSMDSYLRFTFITGVSKFTKTSIFSELNNLYDITLTEEYANICGIATEDLDAYFGECIGVLSKHENFRQYDNLRDEILAWYDGYSWDGKTRVINPFSLITFFMQKRFSGFWFASGSPKFLIDLIKKKPADYVNLSNLFISEFMLDVVELEKITVEPLLFQTGYLTIREIILTWGSPMYLVQMPNYEVREALNLHVVSALTESDEVRSGQMQMGIRAALGAGDLQKMLEILRGFFASIPYNLHIEQEAYYHSIFYALMSALGLNVGVEISVSVGRADAILEFGDKVYVMEFKYKRRPTGASEDEKAQLIEQTLREAMEQMKDRGYGAKYQGSGKTVYQVAVVFLGRGEIEMAVDVS